MAYFSKETYLAKSEYAHKISATGIRRIAVILSDSDDDIDDIEQELEAIQELSHKRHEIHSTNRKIFVYDASDLDEVGTEFSCDETIIDKVNALNNKYQLVSFNIKTIACPECDINIDSDEDILDSYGLDYDDCEDNHDKAFEALCDDWDNIINDWSDHVRSWFKELNEKFDTDFPA